MNNLSAKYYHKTKKVYNIGLRKLLKPPKNKTLKCSWERYINSHKHEKQRLIEYRKNYVKR